MARNHERRRGVVYCMTSMKALIEQQNRYNNQIAGIKSPAPDSGGPLILTRAMKKKAGKEKARLPEGGKNGGFRF